MSHLETWFRSVQGTNDFCLVFTRLSFLIWKMETLIHSGLKGRRQFKQLFVALWKCVLWKNIESRVLRACGHHPEWLKVLYLGAGLCQSLKTADYIKHVLPRLFRMVYLPACHPSGLRACRVLGSCPCHFPIPIPLTPTSVWYKSYPWLEKRKKERKKPGANQRARQCA